MTAVMGLGPSTVAVPGPPGPSTTAVTGPPSGGPVVARGDQIWQP